MGKGRRPRARRQWKKRKRAREAWNDSLWFRRIVWSHGGSMVTHHGTLSGEPVTIESGEILLGIRVCAYGNLDDEREGSGQ